MGRMNPAQAEVVRLVMQGGSNVFFHGAAGTGKSFVLQTLVALLKAARGKNAVAVAAPTVRPSLFAHCAPVHIRLLTARPRARWVRVQTPAVCLTTCLCEPDIFGHLSTCYC